MRGLCVPGHVSVLHPYHDVLRLKGAENVARIYICLSSYSVGKP